MINIISSMVWVFPLFLVSLFIYKLLFHTSSTNQPPSPIKLPIFGNLHNLSLLPHRSLHSLSKHYGELMLLHLGSVPMLIASSADAAREIMKTHDMVFASRPKIGVADQLMYGSKDIALAPYGEYWRQVRSIAVLHLLSTKRVQSYSNVRKEETSLMIDNIERLCSSSALVNLSELLGLLANDIVCRVTLGKKYNIGGNGRKFQSMLNDFRKLLVTFSVGEYIPWLAWVNRVNGFDAKVKRTAKAFDEFLEGVIEEHVKYNIVESKRGTDFVDILLEIQKENLLGYPIQKETIKAVILDMFVAGTDTTHATLEWAMSELIRNPKVMHKLNTEIREIAQGKEYICEDDILKMPYLKAVIKETLRLHPSLALVPREATQNVKLMGYEIKGGTQVIINVWAIGRDPLCWELPEEFQPERFMGNKIDFKGFDFEFIPFGAGRRGCPGTNFALDVTGLALANLLNNFNFALPNGTKSEDLDMTEAHGGSVQRKFPLVVMATRCSD